MHTSMNFDLFKESVIQVLKEKLGEGYEIFTDNVQKNNGIVLNGIIIKEKDRNASPTIYAEDFYEEYKRGVSIKQIGEVIYDIFIENRYLESVDLSRFNSYEKAKGQIAYKLINYEKNWKLLQEIPHRIFYNLALVFYYVVKEPPFCGKASILVTHKHLKYWEVEEEELYRNAIKNTPLLFPPQIRNIEDVMYGLAKRETPEIGLIKDMIAQLKKELGEEFEQVPMYVLTNHQNHYGASCMLYSDVIKDFAKKMEKNLYILPSSIHEVILLPDDESQTKEELLEMVTDINRTQVEECEVLADSVYYYHKEKDYMERLC